MDSEDTVLDNQSNKDEETVVSNAQNNEETIVNNAESIEVKSNESVHPFSENGNKRKRVATKKRVVKVEGVGQLHVQSSFNNVIVTVANGDGQVISWSSAGNPLSFRT